MCIGTQKGGTSTLHDILLQHPDLALPELKETHFFRDVEKFQKGLTYYFKHFFNNSNKLMLGEIDPEYSYFVEAADRIKQCFSDLKIIMILRNPVDRAYSHYLMSTRRGLEELDFDEAILLENSRLQTHKDHIHYSYIARGKYLEQIKRFESLFGASNVKIILFEDLVKNTKKTVDSITQFVGLNSYNYDYNIKSNPASEHKNKWIRDFIFKPNALKKVGGRLIPSKKIKDRIMMKINTSNLQVAEKKPLSRDKKRQMYLQNFEKEIDQLEAHLNLDLTSWKYQD